MVEPASRAAIESGCHGLLIEIASDRPGAAKPKCDAAQAISPETLERIIGFVGSRPAYSEGKTAYAV
jgi:3-deoxy-D-arabino-heptulosonate 7-phosphate (DAHP) synthase